MKPLTHTVTLHLDERTKDRYLAWKVNDEPEAEVLRQLLLSATPTPVVTISPTTERKPVDYRELLDEYHRSTPPLIIEDLPAWGETEGHSLESHSKAVEQVRASLTDAQWADVSIVMAIQATSIEAKRLAETVLQYYHSVHDYGLDNEQSIWLKKEIVHLAQSSQVLTARKKVLATDQNTDKSEQP